MQHIFIGLCGNTALLDFGGMANLFPLPKKEKRFHFENIIRELNRNQINNFILGGGLCVQSDKYLGEVYYLYFQNIKTLISLPPLIYRDSIFISTLVSFNIFLILLPICHCFNRFVIFCFAAYYERIILASSRRNDDTQESKSVRTPENKQYNVFIFW